VSVRGGFRGFPRARACCRTRFQLRFTTDDDLDVGIVEAEDFLVVRQFALVDADEELALLAIFLGTENLR
jgi:hypothetical protein